MIILVRWSWIIMKLIRKKTFEKKKLVFRRGSWFIHHCKIYLIRKYMHLDNCIVNDGVLSTSSQIVEQIEVFQGVVLPGISKMNDSVPVKKPKEQIQFSPKKSLVKGKWF